RTKRSSVEDIQRRNRRGCADRLQTVGEGNRASKQPNRAEKALHFFVADEMMFQRLPRKMGVGEEVPPRVRSEGEPGNRRDRKRADDRSRYRRPAARKQEGEWERQNKLRLHRHQAENETAENRPAIPRQKPGPENRRGQESVLPVRASDEHRGKRQKRDRIKART